MEVGLERSFGLRDETREGGERGIGEMVGRGGIYRHFEGGEELL